MAAYESEHTKFMREWLAEHPQELIEQKKGRALWWDKPQEPEMQNAFLKADIPTKPYYYDTDH